jgi:hypothetical protein
MDELRTVASLRPQPPGPAPAAVAAARARLDEAAADVRSTRRARIPLGWRLAGAGALSAALVAGLVAVEALQDPKQGGPLSPEPAAATRLLDRAARAVTAQPYAAPRPDQFGYRDVLIDETDSEGRFREQARSWTSVGDDDATSKVCSRKVTEPPAKFDCAQPRAFEPPGGSEPRMDSYEYLRTLPRDPQKLLDALSQKATGIGTRHEATLIPEFIADLVANPLAPPDLRAALFRAVALVPGVMAVDSVTDAASRTGTAAAWTGDGMRYELIFDRETHEYLGFRMVLVDPNRYRDLTGVPAGTVVHSTALLDGGIVDKPGDLP